MSEYRPPAVEILAIEQVGKGVNRLTLRLLEPELVAPPLAPASLVPLTGDWRVILELHRIMDGSDDTWTFATSDQRTPPEPGSELGLQQWWIPDAFEIVADTSRRWTEAMFDDTAPDFCLSAIRVLTSGTPRLRTVVPGSAQRAMRSTW